MNDIKIKSRAKINLSLDVLAKRPDGYHEVQMIMQQIDLYDHISITKDFNSNNISIETDCEFIPTNHTNIAYKAAEVLKNKFKLPFGFKIDIKKNIPVAAGLAGGSANAAGVLKGINELCELNLTLDDLMDIGVKIGADVPFCLMGSAALAEGIGENLTPIEGLKNVWIVLAKPSISVSTAEVYRGLDLNNIKNRPDTTLLLNAIKSRDLNTLSKEMSNVLETVTEKKYYVIKQLKNKMMEFNAMGTMMSGSGPTVFGIFKNYKKAKAAYENLSIINKQTYLVQTYTKEKQLS
ncbi:4-(cytidine 5'-diphospho)-2-C-methyl-D-erythritol kinase [Serpentinicella sp. ANB-PHB4]|uniref:4-(cytidine 5'-diphospho)-2-C-methyl-D-erythritol kinase n=1 Tax=Serpentinicella sp. ANB-PHB4 TaxID=3074076 RepID=UPI002857A851|nr:4-(cytidine 5'-diphospho)-2-C-methyl-D-erythritol kinase [Serpentinicella sp. ANB-PHB4]MDR5659135.1 4-(cytidine 5'-diphospho)-2-C-methyl-D-erythritol kinase [Serpentinicella sp. ANB-PHB4]